MKLKNETYNSNRQIVDSKDVELKILNFNLKDRLCFCY